MERWSRGGFWHSLDHHGDGDIVVVSNVLLLISVLLQDGVESVVSNNLSERFQGNGLNVVKGVGWGHLKCDCLNLINWDIEALGVLVEVISIRCLGAKEALSGWSSVVISGLHETGSLWLLMVPLVMLLVMLLL